MTTKKKTNKKSLVTKKQQTVISVDVSASFGVDGVITIQDKEEAKVDENCVVITVPCGDSYYFERNEIEALRDALVMFLGAYK